MKAWKQHLKYPCECKLLQYIQPSKPTQHHCQEAPKQCLDCDMYGHKVYLWLHICDCTCMRSTAAMLKLQTLGRLWAKDVKDTSMLTSPSSFELLHTIMQKTATCVESTKFVICDSRGVKVRQCMCYARVYLLLQILVCNATACLVLCRLMVHCNHAHTEAPIKCWCIKSNPR